MGHIKKVVEYIRQEDFIPLVEERPAIWNIHCEEYGNRNLRKQAWESIYIQFFDHYHESSPEEQTEIAICFQTKWKSLRNSFSRELKKRRRGLDHNHKPYVHFDQLRFLEKAQRCVYYAVDGATGFDDSGNNSDASSPPPTSSIKRIKLQNSDAVQMSDIVEAPSVGQDDPDESGEDSNDSTANHDDSAVIDKDGDKLFIMSLVPEFKRIPENKRLLAKSEILNVILKAQGFV